jgi:hypothetical protein
MKKLLNPDKNIFRWDLEAIKELRQEGLDNIALALSEVREILEVDAVGSLLKETGLIGIPLGIVVNGPNLIYAYDYYLAEERGVSFLLLDREAKRELAAAKRGTEWDNVNTTLITDNDVDNSLKKVTLPVTKTQAAKFGVSLYLTENPTNPAVNIYKRNRIVSADIQVHQNNFAEEYSAVVGAVKDLKDGKGALVIRANTVFGNAGSISALREIKGANPDFKIAIWAKDASELDRAMDIGGLADIISLGLEPALSELNDKGIPLDRIMLVSFNKDKGEISKVMGEKPGLRAIFIDTSRAKEDSKINSMSLVFARAIAGIFQKEESVIKPYQELVQNYKASGQMSAADLAAVSDLTAQISTVPLVKVSEDTAETAATYEITFKEVGGEV